MATGKKSNWDVPTLGQSIEDKYGVLNADAELLTTKMEVGGIVIAVYTGSVAISTKYDGLPIGSIIFDLQAYNMRTKYNATTGWKTTALA